MANYVRHLQPELRVGYFRLVTVTVDDYLHTKELLDAVGAHWTFLCDFERRVIGDLEIVDVTDRRYSPVAIPYTFVVDGKLQLYRVYDGWWYVGRPTVDEKPTTVGGTSATRRSKSYGTTSAPSCLGARTGDMPTTGTTMPFTRSNDTSSRTV